MFTLRSKLNVLDLKNSREKYRFHTVYCSAVCETLFCLPLSLPFMMTHICVEMIYRPSLKAKGWESECFCVVKNDNIVVFPLIDSEGETFVFFRLSLWTKLSCTTADDQRSVGIFLVARKMFHFFKNCFTCLFLISRP